MSFALRHGGPSLFRQRAHLEWVAQALPVRAAELGWNGKEPIHYLDGDGHLLGGFVPNGAA